MRKIQLGEETLLRGACMCVHACVCVRVHVCVCMRVCVCVHVLTHTVLDGVAKEASEKVTLESRPEGRFVSCVSEERALPSGKVCLEVSEVIEAS